MNDAEVSAIKKEASRCSKVKELLMRYNMVYEERKEGNTVIIDIKAKINNGFHGYFSDPLLSRFSKK